MRIQIPLVIEMTDEQVKEWASDNDLARTEGGKVMAKTIVEDMRSYVLTGIQGLLTATGYAEVSIK